MARSRYDVARGGDPATIESLLSRLKALAPTKGSALTYYAKYWRSYADYQVALLNLGGRNRDLAKSCLADALQNLNEADPQDAEVHALRALVIGLNLAFSTSLTVMNDLTHASEDLRQAAILAPTNVRVLYASAVADYATPANYGGRRKAEGLLRNALGQAPEPNRPLRPTWGQDDCAALLIKILLDSDRQAEAKSMFEKYQAQFPNSAPLTTIERKL